MRASEAFIQSQLQQVDTEPLAMGGGKKKSIWKTYDKSKEDYKRDDNDKLHYRINRKTGRIETNLLEWERSRKNMKILKSRRGTPRS